MLHELRISDLGVIDEAVLEPHPGFTVVTGETGAGKTMIVTALGLITGGRGDACAGARRQRPGRRRGPVGGASPTAPAAPIVAAAGGRLDEDGSVIAVRSVGADGRSRAHVGGRAVPLAIADRADRPADRRARTVRGASRCSDLPSSVPCSTGSPASTAT